MKKDLEIGSSLSPGVVQRGIDTKTWNRRSRASFSQPYRNDECWRHKDR